MGGWLVGEPGMTKLIIIRHVFHNFERTEERALGRTGSRYRTSTFFQLILRYLYFFRIIRICAGGGREISNRCDGCASISWG